MALDLASLFGAAAPTQLNTTLPDTSSTVPGNIQGSTSVDPAAVTAQGNPGVPGGAYNNVPEVQAMQQVTSQYPQHSGLFGVHGTLRNVLGTLGDAFLISAGHQPIYSQKINEEHMADAMAGFASDPRAAAGRVAAVAAPNAPQTALSINQDYQTQELRKAQQEQNNWYRQSTVQQRQATQLDKVAPVAGAILNDPSIKTPDDYAKAHQRVTAMVQRIDPNATPADIGAVDPADWKPGMSNNYGMTAGQVSRADVSKQSIAERAAASAANNATSTANNVRTNGARPPAGLSSVYGTIATKLANGQPLTDGEQKVWSAGPGKTKTARSLPAGLTVPSNGGHPAPDAGDIAYLKSNPHLRQQFEARFGPGSSSQYLGQ